MTDGPLSGQTATEGSLSGQTAVVTGASAGIGRETARVLAREGANVSLAARREERLEEVAAEIESAHGAGTPVGPTDVTDEDSVERCSTGSRT